MFAIYNRPNTVTARSEKTGKDHSQAEYAESVRGLHDNIRHTRLIYFRDVSGFELFFGRMEETGFCCYSSGDRLPGDGCNRCPCYSYFLAVPTSRK